MENYRRFIETCNTIQRYSNIHRGQTLKIIHKGVHGSYLVLSPNNDSGRLKEAACY